MQVSLQAEPWIKVNPNYKQINAAEQLKDPNSIFHYYQKLIRLRKEMDIIVYGEFEALYRDHEQIFAYIRRLGTGEASHSMQFQCTRSGNGTSGNIRRRSSVPDHKHGKKSI